MLRVDRDATDLYNSPVPPEPFNLTGIGGQFDASSPFSTGYQVIPRYVQDISSLVAIKEVDFSANVRLSPNPVQDILYFTADQQFDRLTVYNLMGQPLRSLSSPAQYEEISVSNLPAGIYMVRIEKAGAAWTTRFVK